MPCIDDICQFLDNFAPTRLAEDWDNVGLLAGDRKLDANRVMTCLTVTPESAAEAIAEDVDLIVSHHPLPFRPLKRITTDTVASRLLWDLIRAGVAIYSPHTGFDSAAQGINQSLGERLGLLRLKPLNLFEHDPDGLGSGRVGDLPEPESFGSLCETIKSQFHLETLQVVGSPEQAVSRIGIACGSGGSFLDAARRADCDGFLTGETTFHTALEAKANGIALMLPGHYASERFAVEELAQRLKVEFEESAVWASQRETDPLSVV